MKVRGLIKGVSRLQDLGFPKGGPRKLQADGQAPGTEAAGYEMPGMPARLAEIVKMSDRYMV